MESLETNLAVTPQPQNGDCQVGLAVPVPAAVPQVREFYDPLEHDHAIEWGDQPTMKFFPDHFLSEATTMLLVLSLYSLLVIFHPAGLEIKANPQVTPEGIKPEWYFLFLYAFLHFVSPVVGTLAPVVGLGLLGALPWLDRNPERAPRKRKVAIVACVLIMLGIVALSILGITE